MKIYAHRGASATHPENTVEAFSEALRLNVDGIELDVHATSDGIPVVIHDQSLTRTASIDQNVDQVAFAWLRERAPQIPTLAEVLDLVGSGAHLDIEVKQAGIERAILDVLGVHPDVRWAISSFDWDILRAIRALNPAAELWLLGDTWTSRMQRACEELGANVVALYNLVVNERAIAAAHGDDRSVMVWTVNDPNRAQQLDTWGADAICTDNPAQIR